jgi:hypothetical protein
MSVYVDAAMIPYGPASGAVKRMRMSHMMADTHAELIEMVDKIGVAQNWIQHEGKPMEHFDISMAKRDLALQNGAVAVSSRQLVMMVKRRRFTQLVK